MTKTVLTFLPSVVLLFLLIGFQGTFAQGDPVTCFFYPDDAKCTFDLDGDGLKNDSDLNPEDPCIPNSFVSVCDDWDNDDFKNDSDPDAEDPCKPDSSSVACREVISTREANRSKIDRIVLEKYGHSPIDLPSKLTPPGTIIYVTDTPNTGRKFEVVCRSEQVLGSRFKPITSPTLSNVQNVQAKISLDAALRAKVIGFADLNIDGKLKNLDSFTLSFRDAHILTLADADLHRVHIKDTLLTEECKAAINDRYKGEGKQRLTVVLHM